MSLLQMQPARRAVWPLAVLGFGLGLTAGWMMLLGYGLFRLIDYAL
jgi:hypothetical protein